MEKIMDLCVHTDNNRPKKIYQNAFDDEPWCTKKTSIAAKKYNLQDAF